jgi:hypothetical protein
MAIPANRDVQADDARIYAPPWARNGVMPADHRVSASPMKARVSDPLSLEPQIVPQPPLRTRRRWVSRLALLGIAAGIAGGLTIITSRDWTASISPMDEPTHGIAVAPAAGNQPVHLAAAPRLMVEDRRANVNEPLLLGLALDGASGHEFLLLKGLQAQTRLSAGQQMGPHSWRLSAFDLGNLAVFAPENYVGTMDVVVDVHAANDHKLASQAMRLEWVQLPLAAVRADTSTREDRPPASQAPAMKLTLQPDELALLLRRGQDMLKLGDISGARLVLRRAAEAGSSDAALMLASTFDPVTLRELGVLGFAADLGQALSWYEQALALGSGEAKQRLDRLRRIGQR